MKSFILLTAIGEDEHKYPILINTRKIRHVPADSKRGGSIVIQDDDVAVEVTESPAEIEKIIIYGSLQRASEVEQLNRQGRDI